MTTLKCSMCGSSEVLGPTRAADQFNSNNAFRLNLVFTKVANDSTEEVRAKRASVCLACGHVALFISEEDRDALRDAAGGLRPVND